MATRLFETACVVSEIYIYAPEAAIFPSPAGEAHASADIHYKGEAFCMLLASAEQLPFRVPASHVDSLAPSDAILSALLMLCFLADAGRN